MLKVAYIGGSWSSNIGNSFYNLGTQALLDSIDGIDVYFIPDPPHWKEQVSTDFDLIENLDVDLVILTGPCLNLRLEKIYRRTFTKLYRKGIKIAFLSAGMSLYDAGEAKSVLSFLEEFNPVFMFYRDSDSYGFLNSLPQTIHYDGLCTSMFLNNAIKVPDLNAEDYYVFNFDGHKEPHIEFLESNVYKIGPVRRSIQEKLSGYPIVRIDNRAITDGYSSIYSKPNVYHSDLPHGYLSILKSARAVFSERVHTCASTLILGGLAQFIPIAKRSFEKRSQLFKRIGVSTIFEKPSQLNFDYIDQQKEHMTHALSQALNQIL